MALREAKIGAYRVSDPTIMFLKRPLRGFRTFYPVLEAKFQPHVLGEIGFHLAQGVLAADKLAGVQLAALIEGDHQRLQVGGGLIAVDDHRQDVMRPMALLQPVQRLLEIGVLFCPAHGLQLFRTAPHEVLQRMYCVLADLLRGAGVPISHDALGIGLAFENRIVIAVSEVCVGGWAHQFGWRPFRKTRDRYMLWKQGLA